MTSTLKTRTVRIGGSTRTHNILWSGSNGQRSIANRGSGVSCLLALPGLSLGIKGLANE